MSVSERGHPCQEYWTASAVFVGQVIDISVITSEMDNGRGFSERKRVRFAVEESFRGVTSRTVEVWTGVGGGDCGYVVDFVTTSLGNIKGTVFDSEGKPVSPIELRLIPVNADGQERSGLDHRISSYPDQEGRYVFDRVPAGRYVVVLNHAGHPLQHEPPFPRTYLPGTSEIDQARIFEMSDGREIEAPDFRLPPRLMERKVEGVVQQPDGKPAPGALIGSKPAGRPGVGSLANADQEGRFSIKCYEGIRYLIYADYGDPQKMMHAEPVEILVTGENEPIKLVITKPGRAF